MTNACIFCMHLCTSLYYYLQAMQHFHPKKENVQIRSVFIISIEKYDFFILLNKSHYLMFMHLALHFNLREFTMHFLCMHLISMCCVL